MTHRVFFLTLTLSSIVGCGDGKNPEEIGDEKRVQEEKPVGVRYPFTGRG